MIYADTDFFVAMIKKDDWLKSGAQEILAENRGNITTSITTLIEVALISNRLGLDIENVIGSIFDLSAVEGISLKEAMEVAYLIKYEGVNIFDAFHATLSLGLPIVKVLMVCMKKSASN